MADRFGYGGFSGVPYPFWLSSPSPHPSASAPPFLPTHPAESNDQTQGGFDSMISHGSYHRSPADWSNPSYGDNSCSQTPSSSFNADNSRPGNFGSRGEDSYKDMFSLSGVYPSKESSSYDFVPLPTENVSERQRLDWLPTMPYNSTTSATVSSIADMLIRNSQEPFYKPIPPSGVYASGNAFDEKRPGQYHPGYDKPESINAVSGPPVEPYVRVPSLPMSSLKTEALFDASQTGIRLGDGRSFRDVVCSHLPENAESSLHSSSVEPVNFDVLLGYGEATGHVKPLSEDPHLRNGTVDSTGSRSPRSSRPLQFNVKSWGSPFKEKREGSGVSSLYQWPNTLVADSEKGISENSLKNEIGDLNYDEHRSWNHFMVSSDGPSAPTMFSMGSESCGAIKVDNGNGAQSAVNYETTPSEGTANQPSENVQANEKTCKLQEKVLDMMNRDKTILLTDLGIKGISRSNADDVSSGQSPERRLCDQGDFPFPASSPRVSSVVNAMHNLSQVLVYECFNNGSWLKPEQLENLDKVVENLTKCLKKITGNKTIAGEASVPTQATHVSCPNVVDLNEASNVVAKDCQGFNVKAPDMDKDKNEMDQDRNEMTQSIKNILASNFPDGEENHPQALLYKNLWLETEAALCSTTCMARYHRIKNEIGNLKLQNRETADSSTFMQETFLNPHEPVSIINNVEQETTESLIKHGSNCGNNAVTMSHDAPQISRFNSDPVDAVLSLMSRSFTGGLEHENFKPDAHIPDMMQQESHASTTEEKHNDVEGQCQILKQQETKRKLKSHNSPDPDDGVLYRLQILKQLETNRKLKSLNCSEARMYDQEDNPEASEVANIGRSSHKSDVLDRFRILKHREAAEKIKKFLNCLDTDSDSDNDQPSNKTQNCDHHWSDTMMTIGGDSQIETCLDTDTEPSAYGKGCESPTLEWEHVLKDGKGCENPTLDWEHVLKND